MSDFRLDQLDGYSSDQGPTFNAGWFVGGGAKRDRSLTVRLLTPMGRPASVQLDLSDHTEHGCSVSLTPARAREVAAALVERAEAAEAEMARWREIVEKQQAEMKANALKFARGSAGMTEEPA